MKKTKKKSKQQTMTALEKKADTIFSKFVRLSYADSDGYCLCYTCGIRKHWKSIDAGHFASRVKLPTRYDLMNVKPQCKKCNMEGGNHDNFAHYLQKEYGEGIIEEIHRMNLKVYASQAERRDLYNHIIEYYSPKVKEMER